MTDLLRILQMLPQATRLVGSVQEAARGNPSAIEYLKKEGWADALDVLLRPGAGSLGKQVVHQTVEAWQNIQDTVNGNIIDGQYRVVGPPWEPFLRRMLATRFGGHIILGAPGRGKTSLALRLAQRYERALGYTVECINLFDEDLPPFGVPVAKETLVKRMRQLQRHLDSLAVGDEDDPDRASDTDDPGLPPQQRIVVIDEASLAMTSSYSDPVRKATLQALANCRHVDWIVIVIGQWAGQIPLPLLGLCTIWVKEPDGDESDTDRDNMVVQKLWEDAYEAFRGLSRYEWYIPPWRNRKSWAYCRCRSLDGQPGYTGLIPFTPVWASETNNDAGEDPETGG